MVPVQGQLPAEVVVVQKVLLVADLFLIDLLEDLADLVIVVGDKVEVRGKSFWAISLSVLVSMMSDKEMFIRSQSCLRILKEGICPLFSNLLRVDWVQIPLQSSFWESLSDLRILMNFSMFIMAIRFLFSD